MTKPARRAPPAVRKYAAAIFADLAQRTKFVDPALATSWANIAGEEFASLCRPGRLTGGRSARTLEVVVANGAAAARVQFEAETLRRRVNNFLGPNAVARILVRQLGGADRAPAGGAKEAGVKPALERFRASVNGQKGEPDP